MGIKESESEVTLLCWTLCDAIDCSYQTPLSMGFSRREYQSGLPFPSPGDLPNPGVEPESPALRADALQSEPPGKSGKVMSLLFNMLSRLVIVFLLRRKHLLISWLQTRSAVILDPQK